jgi:hypothetical protein
MKTTPVRAVSLPDRIFAVVVPKGTICINSLHIDMRNRIIEQIEVHKAEKFHVLLIKNRCPNRVNNIL